jgi:hypothetical protein
MDWGGAFLNTPWYENNFGHINGKVYIGNVLYRYQGEMPPNTHLVVREGTVSIGGLANLPNLISVTIPASVESIREGAFFRNRNLRTITVQGNGLRRIEEQAFEFCHGLESINLPHGLESIGRRAFSFTESLQEIKIPYTVTHIDHEAFSSNLFGQLILVQTHTYPPEGWSPIWRTHGFVLWGVA